jgi:hypothetical protein
MRLVSFLSSLFALPTVAFSLMAKRKFTAKELLTQAGLNSY